MAENEGARRLAASGMSLAAIAKTLEATGVKVSRQGVDNWRSGRKLPALEARDAMALAPLSIPVEAWDEGARGLRAKALRKEPPQVAGTPAIAPELPEGVGSASELAQDFLVRIQGYRELAENAKSDVARRQWMAMEANAIKTFAKLTGQEAAPEAQLVKSPHWQKIRAVIVAALEPFPEALSAVRLGLQKLDAV